ncbi:MAG: ABC-F family ATP-binding cassette domain-containing protein [Anaerolineales bacterium]|nr:ABC-F family ATP-binding cassette domain-containing protein [Anaerolineales bacterium]
MNLITLTQVSKQYSERLLLDSVDLLINRGDRIGLIGVNGSGKTTLLRIIAAQEAPDNGQVTIWGGVRIQYLAQEPALNPQFTVLEQLFDSDSPQIKLLRDYEQCSRQLQQQPQNTTLQGKLVDLTDEMERTGSWAAEANAKAILTRLGITGFDALVGTLSGGQKKRVALARALIDPADLLILDEPTNHIDAETIAWLEDYLVTVPGALLMVTHDRYFLDRVVNRIIMLDRRDLVNYPGNYTRYLELCAQRHEQLATAEEKRRSLLRRELEWLHRSPMARGTKQKARIQRVAELQQISYDRGDQRVMMALASRRLGKKVLEATGLSKRFGDLQLFQNVDFTLAPGERIGLIGPNGIGKTTFLDILTDYLPADSGVVTWGETVQIGYYDQHSRDLDYDARVLDFIVDKTPLLHTPDGDRIEAAQMLEWFLFPRPQQQAYISALSGGERRRLYLLSILAAQPNVLILDEPTNDLDIQTLTVLEAFLDQFQGCLIVVSHDRYFLDRTVDFLATFDNGRFSARYPTPYSTYQRLHQEMLEASEAKKEERSEKRNTLPALENNKPRKLSWAEKRELEELNGRIATLEAEKESLQTAVNQAGSDYTQLQTLATRLAAIDLELDTMLERWLALSEIAEDV